MRGAKKATFALAVLASGLLTSGAHADDPATVALAESLFRDGKQLMAQKRYAEACPKLAESQRIDAAGGTQLALASCWELAGKLASAWTVFLDAGAVAKRDHRTDREAAAKRRADDIAPRLSHLTLDVPADVRALPGLEVTIDGNAIGSGAWGTALPMDGGGHRVVARATSKREVTIAVDVAAERDQKTVRIPALEDVPLAPPLPTASSAATEVTPRPAASPVPSSSSAPPDTSLSPAVYVVGGVSLVAVALGAYFGVSALSKQHDVGLRCPDVSCPDAAAVDEIHTARTDALVSNIAFGVGIVGAVTTVYLALRSPATEPTTTARSLSITPTYSHATSGISLGGSF